MLDINSLQKIENFIYKELNVNLADAAIFKHDDNNYELFNKYYISKISENKFLVSTSYEQKTFAFLKNAVMWCTFKRRDKFFEMSRIEELDTILSGLDIMIEQHKRLVRLNKDVDTKLIYLAKLNEDKLKKQSILNELKKYTIDAKFWQLKKFETTVKSLHK